MRATWRDGVATLFVVLVGVVVLAVYRSWDWPLLGSYRAGTVALLVLATPMCAVGGYAFWNSIAFQHPIQAMRDPLLAVTMLMGPVAIVLVIGGLVAGTEAWFLGLALLIGVKWLIATTRHIVELEPSMRGRPAMSH